MASASIRPPKPESMPARFNYPSLPGNPDSTQPKSALIRSSFFCVVVFTGSTLTFAALPFSRCST
jgi:hypothetical protein